MIVLTGVIGADAKKVAERNMAGIRSACIEIPDEQPLNVRVSVGIASIQHITSTTEIEPILQQGGQAMMRAGSWGKPDIFGVSITPAIPG